MTLNDWPSYGQVERIEDSIDELKDSVQKQNECFTELISILNIAFASRIKAYKLDILTYFVEAWKNNAVRENCWIKVNVDNDHTIKLYIKEKSHRYYAYKKEKDILASADTLDKLANSVVVNLRPKLSLKLVQVIR